MKLVGFPPSGEPAPGGPGRDGCRAGLAGAADDFPPARALVVGSVVY